MGERVALGLIACLVLLLTIVFASPDKIVRPLGWEAVSYSAEPKRENSAGQPKLNLRSKKLPVEYDYLAPDGSEVRLLVRADQASMAQVKLPAGHTSGAVAHHSVEELWYVVSGCGQMWRKLGNDEENIVELSPGVSVSIPPGTHFQFRSTGSEPLEVIGLTVPAWPGAEEAYSVDGKWPVSRLGN